MPKYKVIGKSTHWKIAHLKLSDELVTEEQLDHIPELMRMEDGPIWNFGILAYGDSGFAEELIYDVDPLVNTINIINNSDNTIKVFNGTSTIPIYSLPKNIVNIENIKGRVSKLRLLNTGTDPVPEKAIIVSQLGNL